MADEDVFPTWASKYLNDKWVARGVPPSVYQDFMHYAQMCGSPIERQMLAGLLFCPFGYYDELNVLGTVDEFKAGKQHKDSALILPQAQIPSLKWRVDFYVILSTLTSKAVRPSFVIECDGHDFHERTKEQAARDRKRDRDLQRLGVPILRFTGSEIFRDLDHCIDQVDTFGAGLLDRAWKDAGDV